MVRRWSCINQTDLVVTKYPKFEKRYKIITFKSLVNLKRFNFKLTKFRRKSMARFKHTSNWLIYSNIIKFWSNDYIFNKHLIKFQYSNNFFLVTFLIQNLNFFKIKNDMFYCNFNFCISTLTKKSHLYFSSNTPFLIKHSPITLLTTNEPTSVNTSDSVFLMYNYYDNIFYPLNESGFSWDVDNLFTIPFKLVFSYLIEIKKIITLLFFYNLNFKKS